MSNSHNPETNVNHRANNRRYHIALAVTIVAIIIVAIVYWQQNREATGKSQSSPASKTIDSLRDYITGEEDSIIDVDTLSGDSTLLTDTLSIDDTTTTAPIAYTKVYDESKREMKNVLIALEQLLKSTADGYTDGSVSAEEARAVGDSALTTLNGYSGTKNAESFKNQINAIKRKANNILNATQKQVDSR